MCVASTLTPETLSCFQHAAFVPKVRAASRSLATGGSDEGFCPNWPEGGDSEETYADEEETRGGDSQAGSLLALAEGAQVPSGQHSAPRSPLQSPASGWGLRQMPPRWLGRVTGVLISTNQPAATDKALFTLLAPSQAVECCEGLAVLAAIELSALAYVPDILQPLRSEAADAFACMIGVIMSNEATLKAVRGMRLTNRLERLKSMLGRKQGPPSYTQEIVESSSERQYIFSLKVCSTHPGPPAGHLPPPLPTDFAPLQLPHQPSGREQQAKPPQPHDQTFQQKVSVSASPKNAAYIAPSSQAPQQQQQQGAASQWEQLNARSRQQVVPVALLRAEELGWGYRQMPPKWFGRIREVLESMRSAAITCGSLLHSLSPRHAVLPMDLSTLVMVEISAPAYLPADLQPLRQAVGASYRQLLERVSTAEPAQSPDARMGLTTMILSLHVALERLSGVPPSADIVTGQYAKKTCIQYRLRRWFISQAGNLQYSLYTQKDLEKAAPRANTVIRVFVDHLRRLLLKAGVKLVELEKGFSPFVEESQSFHAASGEQFSACMRHPHSQDPQQVQSALLTPHNLQLSPEFEQRPAQPPVTSAVSPPGPAQPNIPTAPTPFFGFPQPSMWTWVLEDQEHSRQRLAQGYFGSPCFFSNVHFSGPTDGGVSGSWADKQHQGSSGGAGGDLGLLELAARVSQWDVSDSEEDEEDDQHVHTRSDVCRFRLIDHL
ncbi:hypothetical protein Esti_000993 [Eimeria stiedai]